MLHRAIDLKFKKGTTLEVTYIDGNVIQFDMSSMFNKYPRLKLLNNRKLFISGILQDYGIIWNDDLDFDTESIYMSGIKVNQITFGITNIIGEQIRQQRNNLFMSQKELASITGIDQSDLSKIERGIANPSIQTLERIAKGLNVELVISFKQKGKV